MNLNKRFRSKSSHKQISHRDIETQFVDANDQCDLVSYRLDITIASYLNISKEAFDFDSIEIIEKPLNKKKNSKKRSIQTQTFNNETVSLIEEIIINLIENNVFADENKKNINLLIYCLEKLSTKSLEFLFNNLIELHAIDLIESLIKLNRNNKLKHLDSLINNNYNKDETSSLKSLIHLVETTRYGVRFNSSEEKRKQALNRFKRAVRFLIINKEWFKNMNKEKSSKEEHFKLLTEYNRLNENSAEFNKKIQMLFNKDDFKIQKNVNNLITDMQRKILTKEKYKRTGEQLESLQEILSLIPKLNTLPRHLFIHVAKLLTLIVFDKGREIVREGHKAFGFYFIVNGSCDVFSVSKDGLFKVNELSSGDTFGENSFKEDDPITPHTIITNKRTELILVFPSDIETYLTKLHEHERLEKKTFITNWWHAKYWNWSLENMDSFVKYAQFLRYSNEEIIIDSSHETFEKLYFIIRGSVQLIRALNKKKLVRICTLEKENYFGVEENMSVNTWYLAKGDTDLIAIDKLKFLSLHKHAFYLLSQLIEEFKLAIPNSDIEIYSYI